MTPEEGSGRKSLEINLMPILLRLLCSSYFSFIDFFDVWWVLRSDQQTALWPKILRLRSEKCDESKKRDTRFSRFVLLKLNRRRIWREVPGSFFWSRDICRDDKYNQAEHFRAHTSARGATEELISKLLTNFTKRALFRSLSSTKYVVLMFSRFSVGL